MSRPAGPKKLAAIEQAKALWAKGMEGKDIREALIQSGLTKAQAIEIVPLTEDEKLGKPQPMIQTPINDEMKAANIEGAIHFLETIAKRMNPNVIDRFPDLGSVRNDALTWGRKLRGIL